MCTFIYLLSVECKCNFMYIQEIVGILMFSCVILRVNFACLQWYGNSFYQYVSNLVFYTQSTVTVASGQRFYQVRYEIKRI